MNTYYVSITGYDLADLASAWHELTATTLLGAKRQALAQEGDGFKHHIMHVGVATGRVYIDTREPEIEALASRRMTAKKWSNGGCYGLPIIVYGSDEYYARSKW